MKIVVLVKEVPDTYGERVLDLETGLADRGAGEAVIDEIGERAIEVALRYADEHSETEVWLVSVGAGGAATNLRKALAMGATGCLHVVDEGLRGADVILTAETLAAAVRRLGFDLVLAGNTSTDGAGGALPAALAELLRLPHATGLASVDIAEESVVGTRPVDGGVQRIRVDLPAVVSITEALPDARFPNFKGIMAAKKKPLDAVSLSDLDVRADDPEAARSIMLSVGERPPREAGVKIMDAGDAGERLADFLVEQRLA